MTRKGMIWLSVIVCTLVALSGFTIANMTTLHAELENFDSADHIYMTYEYKLNDKDEYKKSPNIMYYRKRDGGYDVAYDDFLIYDNVVYGNRSKAQINEEESVRRYNDYFKERIKPFEENGEGKKAVFSLAALPVALMKHRTPLTFKFTRGNVTEYRLYLGRNFIEDLAGNDNVMLEGLLFPVVVTFTDGRLSQIQLRKKIRYKVYYDFNSYIVTNTIHYKISYDYEKTVEPTEVQKNFPYGFYQDLQPKKVIDLRNCDIVKFAQEKCYWVEGNSEIKTFTINDLKTGTVIDRFELPEGVHNLFEEHLLIHENYVYLALEDINKILRYDQTARTIELYEFGGSAQVLFPMKDEIFVWIINPKTGQYEVYCGRDLDSLERTTKFDGYRTFYYCNEELFAMQKCDGKYSLVKLSPNGLPEKKIELADYRFAGFNSKGAILSYSEIGADLSVTTTHIQYDFELEPLKSYQIPYLEYFGLFREETEQFLFFDRFAYDKESGIFYGYDAVNAFIGEYTKIDDTFYYRYGSAVFRCDEFTVLDNFH